MTEIDVDTAEPLFRRTVQALAAGDPAAAALLPDLERFPDYGPGWLAVGDVLLRAERREAALIALRRAVRAAPQSRDAAHRLGQCLIVLGQRDAAIATFRHALTCDPRAAETWYSLGLALQDGQHHAEASDAYRAAVRARPSFHEAALNLGIALQEQGRMEEALDAYATAFRSRPESFGRIAQALVSGRAGALWLRPEALRDILATRVSA
jgi:tetratricopeptide (TPR) repeat protein